MLLLMLSDTPTHNFNPLRKAWCTPFFFPPVFPGCGLDDLLCSMGEFGAASLFEDSGLCRVEVKDSFGTLSPMFNF